MGAALASFLMRDEDSLSFKPKQSPPDTTTHLLLLLTEGPWISSAKLSSVVLLEALICSFASLTMEYIIWVDKRGEMSAIVKKQ